MQLASSIGDGWLWLSPAHRSLVTQFGKERCTCLWPEAEWPSTPLAVLPADPSALPPPPAGSSLFSSGSFPKSRRLLLPSAAPRRQLPPGVSKPSSVRFDARWGGVCLPFPRYHRRFRGALCFSQLELASPRLASPVSPPAGTISNQRQRAVSPRPWPSRRAACPDDHTRTRYALSVFFCLFFALRFHDLLYCSGSSCFA